MRAGSARLSSEGQPVMQRRVVKRDESHELKQRGEAGFSLLELVIAMGLMVFVMSAAAALIGSAVNIRSREDRRSDGVADVRRSLNAMTREIGNAGYELPPGLPGNGIVAADSNSSQIRVVSNLDKFSTAPGATPSAVASPDEDVLFRLINDATNNESYILRFDVNADVNATTVLANRIDAMVIHYFDRRVTYTPGQCGQQNDITNVRNSAGAAQAEVTPGLATYVVISVCVTLPQVGAPGAPGYQPASRSQLISDVMLRNASASSY